MLQSRFLHMQEVAWSIAASREACERARSELIELKAATREALTKSRELMAEIDAAIARGQRLRNGIACDPPDDVMEQVPS